MVKEPTSPVSNVTRQTDVMDPARAAAFEVALGKLGNLGQGDALPPFYHQLYFWQPEPPEGLGRDGPPRVGGLIPDMGLPRRMWAGGAWRFTKTCSWGNRPAAGHCVKTISARMDEPGR